MLTELIWTLLSFALVLCLAQWIGRKRKPSRRGYVLVVGEQTQHLEWDIRSMMYYEKKLKLFFDITVVIDPANTELKQMINVLSRQYHNIKWIEKKHEQQLKRNTKLIWIDLTSEEQRVRLWSGEIFNLR